MPVLRLRASSSESSLHTMAEWTSEEMEAERPPCFDFFLGECTNGASCNYNHLPIFKAGLMNIPQTASKDMVSEELRPFRPVHIAYTGNPAQCNFGRGCGIVGFSNVAVNLRIGLLICTMFTLAIL